MCFALRLPKAAVKEHVIVNPVEKIVCLGQCSLDNSVAMEFD